MSIVQIQGIGIIILHVIYYHITKYYGVQLVVGIFYFRFGTNNSVEYFTGDFAKPWPVVCCRLGNCSMVNTQIVLRLLESGLDEVSGSSPLKLKNIINFMKKHIPRSMQYRLSQ